MGLQHSMYTGLDSTMAEKIQALWVTCGILDESRAEIATFQPFFKDETCWQSTIGFFYSMASIKKQYEVIKTQRSELLSSILAVWKLSFPGYTISPIRQQLDKLFLSMEMEYICVNFDSREGQN